MSSNAQSATAATGLERYRGLPDDVAPASVQRAIAIHDHWEQLADRSGGDVVSTAHVSLSKHLPAYLREELGVVLGEDLAWTQIYRAMRKLAAIDARYQYIERPRLGTEPGRRNDTVRELHRFDPDHIGGDGADV